jgi:REP element-mobilizing transposase RayT
MKDNFLKEGYPIIDQFATHFLTLEVCGGIDLFTKKVYRDILIDAFKYAQQHHQLILNGYVIMCNHIHLVGRANDQQKKTLSDIIRDFKKFTHHTMFPIIESGQEERQGWMIHQFAYFGKYNPNNESKQIWTNNNHPEECFTKEFTDVKLNFIHQNPVRAGIVGKAEDYIYSSASNYAGKGGILDVEIF